VDTILFLLTLNKSLPKKRIIRPIGVTTIKNTIPITIGDTIEPKKIPNLYIKNQRLMNVFEGPISPFILILVAALNVSSIITSWQSGLGESKQPIAISRGEEMGRFNLGSTVLLLFPETSQLQWSNNIEVDANLKMGEIIAEIPIPSGLA